LFIPNRGIDEATHRLLILDYLRKLRYEVIEIRCIVGIISTVIESDDDLLVENLDVLDGARLKLERHNESKKVIVNNAVF